MIGKAERIRVNRITRSIRVRFGEKQVIHAQGRCCLIYINKLTKRGIYTRRINFDDLQIYIRKIRSVYVTKIDFDRFGVEKLILEINA